jgi:hypothetical protein
MFRSNVLRGMMKNVRQKLRALSITYWVLGLLCVPASLISPLLMYPHILGRPAGTRGSGIGVFMLMVGVGGLICSLAITGCLIYTGLAISAHKSRTFVMVIACALCFAVPIGTVIGAATLIVLASPEARDFFLQNKALKEEG